MLPREIEPTDAERAGPPPGSRAIARRGLAVLSITAAAILGSGGSQSFGDEPTMAPGPGLRAFEVETLGPEHAAEHAYERRVQRQLARMTPEQMARLRARERRTETRLGSVNESLPPERYGRWTTAPFEIPGYAIHSILLSSGKVLFWGYPPLEQGPRDNLGAAYLWDPSLGTGDEAFKEVPPPEGDPDGAGPQGVVPLPIYCSGQSQLPNGEILVTGGSIQFPTSYPDDAWSDWGGLNSALTFDPISETWTTQPEMAIGRWYPSQLLMGDGGSLVIGGFNDQEPGGVLDATAEIFTPGGRGAEGQFETIADYEGDDVEVGTLYPHLFQLPDSSVAVAGPLQKDTTTLDLSEGYSAADWRPMDDMNRYRQGGTAVLQPGGPRGSSRILEVGGYGYDGTGGDPVDGRVHASATTEAINASKQSAEWSLQSPLNIGRSQHNTVLLPDGSMVTVGGGDGRSLERGNYTTSEDGIRRRVELWDPVTREWRLGPAQAEDRTYHSTALLLPDGRVWSAGDDLRPITETPSASPVDTGEIYSPPYLFKGPRPVIREAPDRLRWSGRFSVEATRRADRAVLVAPGAPTHAVDMGQRVVRLKTVRRSGRELTLAAPPTRWTAPPGRYMLFVLNEQGIPSVSRWVSIGPAAAR